MPVRLRNAGRVLVANLYLIIVIVIVLLVIGFVIFLTRRSRNQAQRDGEVSNARRRQRDEEQPVKGVLW